MITRFVQKPISWRNIPTWFEYNYWKVVSESKKWQVFPSMRQESRTKELWPRNHNAIKNPKNNPYKAIFYKSSENL